MILWLSVTAYGNCFAFRQMRKSLHSHRFFLRFPISTSANDTVYLRFLKKTSWKKVLQGQLPSLYSKLLKNWSTQSWTLLDYVCNNVQFHSTLCWKMQQFIPWKGFEPVEVRFPRQPSSIPGRHQELNRALMWPGCELEQPRDCFDSHAKVHSTKQKKQDRFTLQPCTFFL